MLVDFEHSDGSLEALDIASLSDGYRTHFSLVVDIARRMVQLNPSFEVDAPDRGTNSEAVILIDEIDLHLDPTWQARVVRGLREAFPRAQFVLTTHSEQVIGSVPATSVRKLVAGDGEMLVENVPFAEGATSERILIELMGATERVEGPTTQKLDEYGALVDRGEGESDEAKALRAELEGVLPKGDERLLQADLEMQKRVAVAEDRGGHAMKFARVHCRQSHRYYSRIERPIRTKKVDPPIKPRMHGRPSRPIPPRTKSYSTHWQRHSRGSASTASSGSSSRAHLFRSTTRSSMSERNRVR